MANKQILLHHIDDYVSGGLEFAEIDTKLHAYLNEPENVTIHDLSVPSLDTVALGFATGQLAYADTKW